MMPAVFVSSSSFTVKTPHYSIEYRKYFTNVHITVVGYFGATESLCIMMATDLFAAFHPSGHDAVFTYSNSL